MSRVLITGLTGNVGAYVYEALKQMKQEVLGAVTSVSKSKDRFADVELVAFDFKNKDTFGQALNDVDRVFLMRPPHLKDPEDLYPFIDKMKDNGIQLVVFLSLMGIENNPIPPHYKIEKYIEKVGIPYCHIRPGFYMQNLSGVHSNEIREKDEIYIPAGGSKCSFIDTKDIGYASAKILSEHTKHLNTSYTITGSESLDYYQIAEIFSDILKRKIIYAKPSLLKFWSYMIQKRKMEQKAVNVMVMLYLMTRLGTASAIYDDYEKITGVKPRTFRLFAQENMNIWQ